MAHIAIDARIINSSTGRYVERLVHYLEEVDTDNDYTILMTEKDKDFYTPVSDRFTVLIADFDQYSLEEQIGFKKFLDDLSPDLVHFCMPQQPILYKGARVTTFHDLTLLKSYSSDKNWLIFHFKQLVGRFVFKDIINKSNHLITDTEYVKEEVIKFNKNAKNKITAIHLAADVYTHTIQKYDTPYKRFILYVGQQTDYKNIQRLGTAHQRLVKKYPDLGLILVGSKNDSAKINESFFESKRYKNIFFTGFLEDEKLNWLYKNTEAYVFPSLMEGFGLPGLEAMSHGAPVVSSNATCLPEVYGDAAHYFEPSNVTDIARAIDEVLDNKDLRDDLIRRGYSQIKKFSWKETAKKTHAIYMDVLETSTNLPEQL